MYVYYTIDEQMENYVHVHAHIPVCLFLRCSTFSIYILLIAM